MAQPQVPQDADAQAILQDVIDLVPHQQPHPTSDNVEVGAAAADPISIFLCYVCFQAFLTVPVFVPCFVIVMFLNTSVVDITNVMYVFVLVSVRQYLYVALACL